MREGRLIVLPLILPPFPFLVVLLPSSFIHLRHVLRNVIKQAAPVHGAIEDGCDGRVAFSVDSRDWHRLQLPPVDHISVARAARCLAAFAEPVVYDFLFDIKEVGPTTLARAGGTFYSGGAAKNAADSTGKERRGKVRKYRQRTEHETRTRHSHVPTASHHGLHIFEGAA
jgi:hypothetical protein